MTRPLVSVLMGVYNRERFVRQSVRSILGQSFRDFELIIVDDGSADSSWEILRSFKDRRLRLTRWRKNYGIAAARNEVLRQARGKWTTFFDSDDLMTRDSIRARLLALKASPQHRIVMGRVGRIIMASRWNKQIRHYFALQRSFYRFVKRWGELPRGFGLKIMSIPNSMATQMFPTSLLRAVGPFDERLKICDDLDVALRVNQRYPSLFIDFPVLHYRIHQSNLSLFNPVGEHKDVLALWQRWAPQAVHLLNRIQPLARRNPYLKTPIHKS